MAFYSEKLCLLSQPEYLWTTLKKFMMKFKYTNLKARKDYTSNLAVIRLTRICPICFLNIMHYVFHLSHPKCNSDPCLSIHLLLASETKSPLFLCLKLRPLIILTCLTKLIFVSLYLSHFFQMKDYFISTQCFESSSHYSIIQRISFWFILEWDEEFV